MGMLFQLSMCLKWVVAPIKKGGGGGEHAKIKALETRVPLNKPARVFVVTSK